MKKQSLVLRREAGRLRLWRPLGVGLLFLCLCPAVYGGTLDRKVTVRLKKVSLQEAIAAIMQQSDYGISYNVDEISDIDGVSLTVRDVSLEEALRKCLEPYGFTFTVHGQTVVIQSLPQQERRVTGTVVDASGEPLAGVSILVRVGSKKEAARGITDIDGRFNLRVSGSGKISLTVRFIGFEEQTVDDTGKPLRIVLQEDTQKLNEIVKIGYYDQSRGNLTGSVTSVMMDDILEPNMTTIDQALEGRIPDLMFTQNSGEVGATARLRVRGTSTLVGNREPLWVLDGFVLQDPVEVSTEQLNDPDYINYVGNAIAGINPQDIERIDVLKDASATALYGTRASNGVIVVTTKKGRPGPPTITYANNTKLTRRPRYSDSNINLMNSQERMQFGKDLTDLHYVFPSGMPMVGYEGAYYRYQTGQISYDEFLAECSRYETTNTDWFKLLTQDAWTQQHTLSISGGSESTRYYASLGYTSETGVIKTEFVDRYTASMNVMTNITHNLMANIRLNGNIQKKNHLPSAVSVLDYAYNTTRALPAYNDDGSLYYYQTHGYSVGDSQKTYNQYNYNIINEMNNTSDDYSGNTFMASADLTYKVKDLIDLTAAASYSRSSTLQTTWFGEKTNYVAILKNGEADEMPIPGETGVCELPYGGVYNTTNTINESFTGRLQANLHWSFGSDSQHLLTSTAGYEVNMVRTDGISDQTRGYYKDRGMKYVTMDSESLDDFPYYKNWLAAGHRSLTAGKTNQLSGYLTAAYSYADYFTVSLSGRFDASNKFGSRSNEKFLPVWSVSGRWNIKETLFPKADRLGELSMRFSYGKTGNMLDGETPNLLIQQGMMDTFYGENVSTVASLPNPNLRWEQTDQYNVGVDLNLFDGRLLLSSDFWYKYTTDAFASVNVALVNGVSSYRMNNGDIKNKGFSFSLSGYPIRTRDWKLYLSTNYSYASNTVQTNTSETYTLENYLNGTAIMDGRPIGTFYSYEYLGLNPNNGVPMFDDYEDRQHLLAGKMLAEVVPMVMVESGNRDPDFTGSLYATLTWKQLSLNTNFNYRIGSKLRLFKLYSPVIRGVSSDKNVRKEFINRWQKPGDEKYTDIPALISPGDPSYTAYSSHWSSGVSASQSKVPTFAYSLWDMYDYSNLRVVPGDYLRLSNLTLSYNFTLQQLAGTFLKSLRLSFNVTNVFTIASSKLDGQDPTQTSFEGVNLSVRPAYTFGLNVSF